jgi:hypothetical protein
MNRIDKTAVIIIFASLSYLSFVTNKNRKEIELELIEFNNDFRTLDSLYQWKSERLKIYVPICLMQSEIIDKFRSSREEAKRNKTLTELEEKLD